MNESSPLSKDRSLAAPFVFVLILAVMGMIGLTLRQGGGSSPPAPVVRTPTRVGISEGAARREVAIRRALDRDVAVDYRKVPFDKVLADLGRQLDVPIQIDYPTLADEGVALDQDVTITRATLTGTSALRQLLEPLQLTWIVQNELLFVTTSVRAGETLETRIYDVDDLIYSGEFDSLIGVLTSTIEPDSWDEVGGPGSIREVDSGGVVALSIRQTQKNQERIGSFLSELRKGRRRNRFTSRSNNSSTRSSTRVFVPPSSDFASSQEELAPRIAALVRGNNELALALYSRLAKESDGNLLISPVCISTALAMLAASADGETADEIVRAAQFVIPQDSLPYAHAELRAALSKNAAAGASPNGSPPGSDLQFANRIWLSEDLNVPGLFSESVLAHFGGTLSQIDFRQPKAAAESINEWVKQETKGMVPEIVSPQDFTGLRLFVIASAVAFHGRWTSPFSVEATALAKFSTGKSQVDIRLMHADKDKCRYASIDGLQVLEKTYLPGDQSLLILLPDDPTSSLTELESRLTDWNLLRWLAAGTDQDVELYLPRFRAEFGTELNDALQARGMKRAFDLSKADFSPIVGEQPAAIDWIRHRASIEVDEKGTRAGAATVMGGFGGLPPPPPVFRADHPFVFLIRDKRTGCILFIGRLVMPEALRPSEG